MAPRPVTLSVLAFSMVKMRRSSIGAVVLLSMACGTDPATEPEDGSSGAVGSSSSSAGGVPSTGELSSSSSGSDPGSSSSSGEDVASTSTGEASICGDGEVDLGEDCDDGNSNDQDACHDDCTIAYTIEYTLEFDAGAGEDEFVSGLTLLDGDVWMAGEADDGRGRSVAYLWRLGPDAEGLTTWSYDPPDTTGGAWGAVAAHPSGDLIVAGAISTPSLAGQAIVARVDPTQEEPIWVHPLDPALGESYGIEVAVGSDGRVYWAGNHQATDDDDFDLFVEVLDADGVEQWRRGYAGAEPGFDFMRGLVVDAQGTVFVAGQTRESAAGSTPWAGAWDGEGEPLLSVPLPSEDDVRALALDDLGDLVVAGVGATGWIERRNAASFALISRDTVSGTLLNAIALDDRGGLWATGARSVTGEGWNIWTGQLEPGAEIDWEDDHDGGPSLNDFGRAIVHDGDAVVAAGTQTVLGEGTNVWVRRYVVSH